MIKKSISVIVSDTYKLIPEDIKAIWRGAMIATAGALLTYVTQVITGANFGQWTPIVVAIWSIVANSIKKYLTTSSYIK